MPPQQSGREEGNPEFSEKVIRITREYLHYLEPESYAVKRENGESGSEFGRSMNRFQKSLASQ